MDTEDQDNGLSDAWMAAEAALPDGVHLRGVERHWTIVAHHHKVTPERPFRYEFGTLPSYEARTWSEFEINGPSAWGETPAKALYALAEKMGFGHE